MRAAGSAQLSATLCHDRLGTLRGLRGISRSTACIMYFSTSYCLRICWLPCSSGSILGCSSAGFFSLPAGCWWEDSVCKRSAWYHYLPSLTLLDEVSAKALLLGFPFLTQGIVTGSVWAKYTYGSYLHWSLTSLPLLLAWLIYALLLGGRRALGWQGTKAARATVGGFVVVLASYFVHTL